MSRILIVGLIAVGGGVRAAAQDAEVYNSQAETVPLRSAADALALMSLPEGFHASVFAAEPDVRQPIGFTTDARGRLWVVENDTYSESRLNFDMRMRDRVVIFEDTDHDGTFDRRTVFWDQGTKVTSVEVGFGGVWVLAAPQLLFIPDADGDDVPDGPPQVLLDGWEDDVIRHNIVNGLRWGPDGWLYGRHGIQATSLVGVPGATDSQRVRVTCGIWRFHPTRREFQVVAQGGTNPWGFDYNQHGEMFMSNTVIGHLWHVVPGARYRRMYGTHFNPYVYEVMEQAADHFHWDTGEEVWNDARQGPLSDGTDRAGGGHAHCGLMIYQGDNWPLSFRGGAFMVNLHGRRVNHDRLVRVGNGYVAQHGTDILRTQDEWFRGLELQYGPDGAVYLLDWSDVGECHENDGVHRTSGRIYKIWHGEARAPQIADLRALTNTELVNLQGHSNEWFVRKSRRILMERAARGDDMSEATALLLAGREQQSPLQRLRAMWCLYCLGHQDEGWLAAQLTDPDEHVRAWAVRLLADRHGPLSPAVVDRLAYHAEFEKSGLVRLYLAAAIQRLPVERRLDVAIDLVHYSEDANDRMQPLMIWYGIEPAVVADPHRAVAVAVSSRIPLVRRLIARRLSAEAEDEKLMEPLMAGLMEAPPPVRADLLAGMSEALRGVRQVPPPQGWTEFARSAARDAKTADLVRDLGVVFGDGRAMEDVRRVARDASAGTDARNTAIAVLTQARPADLFEFLQPLINDRSVSTAVVHALAECDDPRVPDVILRKYRQLSPDGRAVAIDSLSVRPASAEKLLAAVEGGQISRSAISAFHARQMRSLGSPRVAEALKRVWGDIRATTAERARRIDELRTLLTDHAADASPSRGRLVFQRTCASCHVLYGAGGRIGPDLTGSNRRDLNYLLENIVDPSASVAAGFRTSVVVLRDGRSLIGVVLDASDRFVTLQTEKERLQIPRNEIEDTALQGLSLMPDGLLKTLTDDQIRDLFAYLQSTRQVPLPE